MEKKAQQSFTILVIDDDDRVRTVLKDILIYGGHQVIEAADGILGMKCLEEGKFDMVLTDLGMPAMNGWEVAKWVKRKAPRIPVGIITGWGAHLDDEQIKESGVDLVIGKPFQMGDILEAVNRYVSPR